MHFGLARVVLSGRVLALALGAASTSVAQVPRSHVALHPEDPKIVAMLDWPAPGIHILSAPTQRFFWDMPGTSGPGQPATQDSTGDHRWDGIILGGVGLGLGGMLVGSQLCEAREDCSGTTVLFGLLGATVGSVIGGFIGASVPKHSP